MNRDQKIAMGLLATAIALFGSIVNKNVGEYSASQLTLTRDGCNYAQTIGLKIEQDKGLCVMQARFRPYVFGDGGVIVLDDDRKIIVTNNMMLAYHHSEATLPLTPAMQAERRWFWIWLAMAAAFLISTLIYGTWTRNRAKGRSK